jgi:hypothetical protein
LPDNLVTVIDVWIGSVATEPYLQDADRAVGNELVYRAREPHSGS